MKYIEQLFSLNESILVVKTEQKKKKKNEFIFKIFKIVCN